MDAQKKKLPTSSLVSNENFVKITVVTLALFILLKIYNELCV